MMFVESDKVYSLKKQHVSDTLAHCARRALKACKQGDGILCENRVAVVTVQRVARKKQVPVIMRKQDFHGWIVYPMFYKSTNPKIRAKYEKLRAELREKKINEAGNNIKKTNSKTAE